MVSGLLGLGITTCVLKHSSHNFMPDPGKDTWLFRKAGALGSGVINEGGLASFFIPHSTIEDSIALLGNLKPDLIICEGFKESGLPKLVIVREKEEFGILPSLDNVLAVVFDGEPPKSANLPIIKSNEKSVVDFVLSFFKAASGKMS
jgi:molybdopterin-guanine dinucleotide biosynthesis protein B